MREKLGALDGKTCVFVGDRTNVCSSTMWITTMFGMHFVHASPEAYQSPQEWVDVAERNVSRCARGAPRRGARRRDDDRRLWMRDTGPSFVVDGRGERRAVDWHFNAWGGLEGGPYFPWDNDDLVAAKVAEIEGAARYRAPLVLEGGSIHVDGERTCLATEERLLNHNRNPELTREAIEEHVRDYTQQVPAV